MKITKTDFSAFVETLAERDKNLIEEFFSNFDLKFSLAKKEVAKFKEDFENAIIYLSNNGVEIKEILSRIQLSNLGGFYARPSILWFSLDDAAKIYPISMEHGRQQVFRMSVYLKQPVSKELLQIALHFTIKRFPIFATTLKKGFFWHYLDAVKKHFSVKEENLLPCQPIKVAKSDSQPFRIRYYENRISVEFFHVLTDGAGAMTFLKALTKEYLRLQGVFVPISDDVWDINEIPIKEEFENAFKNVEKAENASGFIEKPVIQMNGGLTRKRPCRMLHFKMNAEKLHHVAKQHGTTITSYLLAQMFYACSAATDELKGDINIQVPVNMRKFYPSKTICNFSMYCGIRMPVEQIGNKETLIKEISKQLLEKSEKEKMREMITSAVKTVDTVRYIPLIIKQPIAKMIFGFLGEKLYTTTFSNLGVIKMPKELSDHIESMDFCLGPHVLNRLACTAVTVNNVTTFTISKMTADPAFEEKLYELLEKDGISVDVEGSDYYAR